MASQTDKPTIKRCSVTGCERPFYGKGLCQAHWQNLRRTGEPVARRIHTASCGQGYKNLNRPGHPLADKSGNVLEHRVVLYAHIGPGQHKCFHCQRTLEWKPSGYGNRRPAPGEARPLTVDHLDNDRCNNDIWNLVPSCQACNVKRGWQANGGRNPDQNGPLAA